jgi:tetrahydromethanopterin S-methyltransferase subunit H
MFKFRKEQKIVEVGGVKLGGQPGELPTVLTATIFYVGHKIVVDEKKGIFDKEKAEALIKKIEEASDRTTNPFILDIVGITEEAFQKFISFVCDVTDAPFQIDAISPRVRKAIAKWVGEVGLSDRAINNSIYRGVKDVELEILKDSGIKASIVLCDNPQDESANGRLTILEEVLPMVDKAGIEAAFLDSAIPCWGIGVGAGSRAIYLIKERFGDRGAVGTGMGNVTDTLGWVKGNFPKEVRRACAASQNAILPILGADWIMFGPIELTEYVFPAVAVIDTYVLTATAELGTRPLIEGMHPLFKTVG